MSTAPAPAQKQQPEKKVQGGRKGKKAWRKNIDLEDVEDGLEELREEERQGGAAIQERKNADLFTVDVAGDSKTKASLVKKKKLRLDEILGRRSKVDVPVIGSKMSEAKRKRKANHETKMRLKKVTGFVEGRRVGAEGIKAASITGRYDVWNSPPPAPTPVAKHAAETVGRNTSRGVVSRKKLAHLAALPAVEVAHPGASYRPDQKHHRDLIEKASADYASVVRKQEKHNHIARFRGISEYESLLERAEIIAQDLEEQEKKKSENEGKKKRDDDSDDSNSDESGDDEDDAGDSEVDDDKTIVDGEKSEEEESAQTKATPRKTRVDRNRERRSSQRRTEELEAKRAKEHLRQLDMAKRINRQVDRLMEKNEQSAERKRKLAREKASRPLKKIGKNKVPEIPEAVKLAEELPGSLRDLKPEANGFSEVYNSFVKRNFIEPRRRVPPRRVRKVKTTEKWSYKDFK
ncbi:P60-like protein [Martensiomyces pterosporus]|nr:P60-like protein [Martensiomyces pterosporus]